jgi:hypothetical protein
MYIPVKLITTAKIMVMSTPPKSCLVPSIIIPWMPFERVWGGCVTQGVDCLGLAGAVCCMGQWRVEASL